MQTLEEIPVPLDTWRKIPKEGWGKLIHQWNYKKGFMKKIPQATIGFSSAYLDPKEQKAEAKRRKANRKQELTHAPHLTWTDVPQRLPYRKQDDTTMLIEKDFAAMVKANLAKRRKA